MMDIARSNFTRQKSRFDVVKKMIELGISVRNDEKLMIKDVHISDTALAFVDVPINVKVPPKIAA